MEASCAAARRASGADHRAVEPRGRGRPPRRHRARRRRRAHAQGGTLLPRRHGGRLRRLGRAAGRRRQGPDDFWSGEVEDGGKGPWRRARTSTVAADRRARQPDQQAERVGERGRGVRASDSTGGGRHGALPAEGARVGRRSHHAQGEAELPEVRVVQHAVLVRRHSRSGCARGVLEGLRRPAVRLHGGHRQCRAS